MADLICVKKTVQSDFNNNKSLSFPLDINSYHLSSQPMGIACTEDSFLNPGPGIIINAILKFGFSHQIIFYVHHVQELLRPRKSLFGHEKEVLVSK